MDRRAYEIQAKQWSCIFIFVIPAFISLLISFISVPDPDCEFWETLDSIFDVQNQTTKRLASCEMPSKAPPCLSKKLHLSLLGMDFLPLHWISSKCNMLRVIIVIVAPAFLWIRTGGLCYVGWFSKYSGALIGSECRTTAATLLQLQEHKSTWAPFLFLETDISCFHRKWKKLSIL